MSTLPTFLVIGVTKAGTTALYQHLKAHPEVYMSPVKEPDFFSYEGKRRGLPSRRDASITSLEDYYALFEGVQDEKAIGEASPRYIYSPVAPARIQELIPEARLIISLRHPVDRAYSHYMMMLNSGVFDDHRPFEEVFREKARTVETWAQEPFACYGLRHSLYHDHLQRYFEYFPKDQIRIHLFDDYFSEPRSVLSDIYQFVGVEAGFVPDLNARYNPTFGIPRNKALHKTVMRPNLIKTVAKKIIPATVSRKISGRILKRIRSEKPTLSEEVRVEFVEVYREDILKVQDLIGRDLSPWLA